MRCLLTHPPQGQSAGNYSLWFLSGGPAVCLSAGRGSIHDQALEMALNPSNLMKVCLSSSRSRSSSGCGRDCLVNVTTERCDDLDRAGRRCLWAFLWIMLESRRRWMFGQGRGCCRGKGLLSKTTPMARHPTANVSRAASCTVSCTTPYSASRQTTVQCQQDAVNLDRAFGSEGRNNSAPRATAAMSDWMRQLLQSNRLTSSPFLSGTGTGTGNNFRGLGTDGTHLGGPP